MRLEVTFPTENPIPFVSVEPCPAGRCDVERTTLDQPISGEGEDITEVVSKITWSGGEIAPGSSSGSPSRWARCPRTPTASSSRPCRSYADGEEVRWIDPIPASGEEPESPAPTLTLTASTGDEHGAADSDDAAATDDTAAADDSDLATTSDVDSAKTIGIIGIVRRRARPDPCDRRAGPEAEDDELVPRLEDNSPPGARDVLRARRAQSSV